MTLAEIHTARILRLAKILEKHRNPKGKKGTGTYFDMRAWATHPPTHRPTVKNNFCGTTACVLGHAAFDPVFRREGLKLKWTRSISRYGCANDGDETDDLDSRYQAHITYRGADGACAGAAFFGLSDGEAVYLFCGPFRSKREVIKRLKRLAVSREELIDPQKGELYA